MSEQNDARQLVVFTLAGEQYGLPIERVHEIIRYRSPRSIASREPLAPGVLNLRGKIVPIYDVAAGLGASAEAGEDTEMIESIAKLDDRVIVLVDPGVVLESA